MKHLESSHDLRLPAWGPYTKAYMGISHIPDPGLGLRFDLSIFPRFYRGSLQIPNVKWTSGYHPWQASPERHYTDVFLRPISLAPQSQREVYGLVCCGTADEVSERLQQIDLAHDSCSPVLHAAQQKLVSLAAPQGSSLSPIYSRPRTISTTRAGGMTILFKLPFIVRA